MAKAVEDTTFYRFNRLIAQNEVGSEPQPFGLSVPEFHAAAANRLRTQPQALSATATHDTKRGEDARLRIAMVAQQPERWRDDVGRWHAVTRSEEHTSELQSLMRISYAVFCLNKKNTTIHTTPNKT